LNKRAGRSAPVGQLDDRDGIQVAGEELDETDHRHAADAAPDPGREPQHRPEPKVQPPHRHHCHQD
jgi:hypothetical protein